jgi:hypothetical protein
MAAWAEVHIALLWAMMAMAISLRWFTGISLNSEEQVVSWRLDTPRG